MKFLAAIILIVCFGACSDTGNKVNLRENTKDSTGQVVVYSNDDNKMAAAIMQARESYASFLNVLKHQCVGCERFSVKIRLEYDETYAEHVWLDSLFFKADKLYGVLASVPEKVERVQRGDIMEAKPDSLSDWMYVEKGKLIGGFTVKLTYDQLGDSEKKAFEEEVGAIIR
jgi:uncharacterized protein YegJ (DUF2314 family)